VLVQLALDHLQQLGIARRAPGDVDLEDEAVLALELLAEHGDRAPHHPLVDLPDQAVALGHGQEGGRRDQLAERVAHAQQQLVLVDLAAGEVHDRLGLQHQALLVERIADRVGPGEARGQPGRGVLGGAVAGDLVAAALLGLVHGQVGVDEDVLAGQPLGVEGRHADARADRAQAPGRARDPDLADRFEQAARGGDLAGEHPLALLCLVLAVVGVQQREHRAALELGVPVAGDGAQCPVHPQDAPVDADDRHACRALLERGAEALLGLGQRALGLQAVGDVADDGVGLERLAGRRVAHDPQLRLDPHDALVAPEEAERGADVVGLTRPVVHGHEHRHVGGVHQVLAGAPHELLRLEAEHLAAGRGNGDDPAVRAVQRDDVGRRHGQFERAGLGGTAALHGEVVLGPALLEQPRCGVLLAHRVQAQRRDREAGAQQPQRDEAGLVLVSDRPQRHERGQHAAGGDHRRQL